jgi:hypothetical protein
MECLAGIRALADLGDTVRAMVDLPQWVQLHSCTEQRLTGPGLDYAMA